MNSLLKSKLLATMLMLLGAGATAIADLPASTAPSEPSHSKPSPKFEGLWVWKPKFITDIAEQDKLLAFCQRQGFNRLLVQVPWKAGSAQVVHPAPGEEPSARTALHPTLSCPTEFARLVAEAAKHQMAVEALDGDPYMGDKVHWSETLATVDALIDFNKTLPENAKIAGIHWDIEPYVRADWKMQATRPPIETEYLDLLTQAKQKLHDRGSAMTLAVDIPMWYDNKTAPDDSCIVTYNGQTKNFHQHIQDITDYVGIMSYRQRALGKNSAFEQVANELAYAEKIGKFVCPAFDTIQLKDTPQITFFGQSAQRLQSERHKLETALENRPGFGGMFIHCYPAVAVVLEPGNAATDR